MDDTQTKTDGRFPVHKLILGLVLLIVGSLAFIDAVDLWNPRNVWRWWPLVVIVVGLSSEIDALIARRDDSGSLLVGFGVWMLAGMQHIFGLGFRTGLPLGIAVVGLFMALHALVDRPNPQQQQKKETSHEPC
jgi:Domain of unknown function (DUF5668)